MPDLPDALALLRDVLIHRRDAGERTVAVTAAALDRLRGLRHRLSEAPGHALSAEPAAPVTAPPVAAPVVEKTAPPTPVSVGDEASRIAALAREAEHCPTCRGLGTLRDTMVFSVGNPAADLMFVGEAPGFEEENQREPFVGPAGQKLTQIIRAMGLRRPEDVYISNIVKFRPKEGDGRFQGQRNRKPTPEEMAASVKYVLAEIEVVRPRVIVALGATAMEGLLGISGSVSRMRNRFQDFNGTPVMVTYHPSYLLRQESQSPDQGKGDKRRVWEDMLLVMEKLGLPVSDKQRGYFL
ncbi:MAG: uracil-DNA glycosylase [Akkermansiaceae bacterium]|nr:uracil-DNA glycosylase [Akkermansiaceae bacterium]